MPNSDARLFSSMADTPSRSANPTGAPVAYTRSCSVIFRAMTLHFRAAIP